MITTIIATPKAVDLEEVDHSLIEGTGTERGSNKTGRITRPRGKEKEKERTKDTTPLDMMIIRATRMIERGLGVLQEGMDPQEMKRVTRGRRGESRTQKDGNKPLREGPC